MGKFGREAGVPSARIDAEGRGDTGLTGFPCVLVSRCQVRNFCGVTCFLQLSSFEIPLSV